MAVGEAGTDGGIRAIGRGLKVLQAINHHRSLSMTSIASICGLPYPTACRIVDTLIAEQMIEREQTRKHYRPTALVRTLSAGYQPADDLVVACRPHIERLTRDVRWPISVCTRVGMSMMIRESTHAIAPYTLNLYHPGYTMPLLGSSSGKVQLAFSSEADRESVLAPLRARNDTAAARIVTRLEAEFAAVRSQGFASFDRIRHTANPGKTSAISVPVLIEGLCQGTVTLAFFSSSMVLADAVRTYLAPLKATAVAIASDLLKLRG
jgi:IclR family mhp operon transcriptional activator